MDDELDSDEDEEDEDDNEDVNFSRGVIVFYSCSDKTINIISSESFGGFEVKFHFVTLLMYCRCYLSKKQQRS